MAMNEPNLAAITRSNLLSTIIQQTIAANGRPISFATYMQLALYHPELGYYNTDAMEIGARGDFTTAPMISPLFAQCFARQCQEILAQLPHGDILELGAGTGHFAKDLLLELKKLGCAPKHYFIFEISAGLRKKQQALLAKYNAEITTQIIWLDAFPTEFSGIVIANEVLDALPVQRFCCAAQVKEVGVNWNGKEFAWEYIEPTSHELLVKAEEICAQYHLPNGYESEINLSLVDFIQTLIGKISCGVILFADYGYGQTEYYHPQRHTGTLTCFYQHQLSDNPLRMPGLQDITAHVDFTRVIEIASELGCTLNGFTTQAAFLLSCGLTDLVKQAEAIASPTEEFELHQAIKTLTLPTEMGETVKVLALGKNFSAPLLGFSFQDRRRDL